MKQNILFICMVGIQFAAQGSSPYLISFFIKPLIVPQQDISPKGALVPSQIFGSQLLHTSIFVTYAGISTNSDHNGQVLLPRKSADPKLHVFITEKINLLPISPSKRKTITGFTTGTTTKLQYLLYIREKDVEADTYVWNVTQSDWPPYKRMPWDAIIIFADPDAIISPLGRTTTQLSENFILPDFYITSTARTTVDTLRFLAIKSFVGPLTFTYSFHPQDIQKIITP